MFGISLRSTRTRPMIHLACDMQTLANRSVEARRIVRGPHYKQATTEGDIE